jgi:enoyl-CoA hydratase/carnithine racemase
VSGLIVTKKDEVGYLRLNMPDTGNKITQSMVGQLAGELRALRDDSALKAIVISAEGAHFCQGRDPGKPDPAAAAPTAVGLRTAMMQPILDVYQVLREIRIPVIALVQGEAHGFGAALAASADITIASDDARFSFPELKSNMPPTLAMATIIDRVPVKALGWLVYTSTVIKAEEAKSVGMVSTIAPLNELQRVADDVIRHLVARDREALIGVKQFLAGARQRNFDDAAEFGANLLAVILSSARK